MQTFHSSISAQEQKQRIDRYLTAAASEKFSRSQIKQLIIDGKVTVNGVAVKPHYKLHAGDEVVVRYAPAPLQSGPPAVNLPLDILYEDDYLLAVNKPAGMVVHPAPGHHDDTLVNALLFHCSRLSDYPVPEKAGIVHRLDRDTSGVMVIAKDNTTHRRLAHQFKHHLVTKVYQAVVMGKVEYDEGVIDAPLSRSPLNRKKMTVTYSSGRQSLTRYRVLQRGDRMSWLELYPKTGRTHQLRVHLALLGHPILGDLVYGRGRTRSDRISRQALHALRLSCTHPQDNKLCEFTAPLPPDMQWVVEEFFHG